MLLIINFNEHSYEIIKERGHLHKQKIKLFFNVNYKTTKVALLNNKMVVHKLISFNWCQLWVTRELVYYFAHWWFYECLKHEVLRMELINVHVIMLTDVKKFTYLQIKCIPVFNPYYYCHSFSWADKHHYQFSKLFKHVFYWVVKWIFALATFDTVRACFDLRATHWSDLWLFWMESDNLFLWNILMWLKCSQWSSMHSRTECYMIIRQQWVLTSAMFSRYLIKPILILGIVKPYTCSPHLGWGAVVYLGFVLP